MPRASTSFKPCAPSDPRRGLTQYALIATNTEYTHTPPIVKYGTADVTQGCRPAPTSRFTCTTPATIPGACPAYRTGHPETSGSASRARFPVTISPSSYAAFSSPAPVIHNDTTEPRSAGFASEFTVPSWLRAAACPVPLISLA